MGDVLDLDIQRRGVEQVQPAAGQHALPRAGRRSCPSGALQPFRHPFVPLLWTRRQLIYRNSNGVGSAKE
ncbi:MAG TPA: hypothetical protein VGL73_13785 [Caulobacteraceae bacterium]